MITSTANHPRLYFLPEELDYSQFSEGVRAAIEDILTPAYRQLVLEAPDELERAAGTTFVYYLFLEIVDHANLGQQIADRLGRGSPSAMPHMDDLNRLFRLSISKERAGAFLLRLRMFRARHGIPVVIERPSEPRSDEENNFGNPENC